MVSEVKVGLLTALQKREFDSISFGMFKSAVKIINICKGIIYVIKF